MLWHQTGNSMGNYRYDTRIYRGTGYRPHFHKNYELLYVISGLCQLKVSTFSRTLETGQLFLIPPYAVHSFQVPEDSSLWISVFSADHISGFNRQNCLFSPFRCESATEAFLKENLFLQLPPDRYRFQACLYLVCDQCVKNAAEEAHPDFSQVVQVAQYVSGHLNQELTLQTVAQALNYEYHYFSRLFHNLFDMNSREFVNLYKIEQACSLLANTDRDIAAIAMDCGFQTVRTFNRAFRSLIGQTPSQYRKA